MTWILLLISLAAENWPRDETVSGYADRDATYALIEVNGAPPPAPATIRFPEEGRVEGQGPCNGYAAYQTVPYPWIKIGAVASTRKACPDLAFETLFFKSLQAATLVEVSGDVLILSDPGGLLMTFQARD